MKPIIIEGTLEVLTGLHIGGTKESFKIGGLDNPVIKIRRNGKEMPYIPGSSLKGKLRYLLEKNNQKNDEIAKIFGSAAGSDSGKIKCCVIFRDCYLIDDKAEVTEIKGENTIDRITVKAKPRFIERVIPGTKFNVEIVINCENNDDKKMILEKLKEGFELLANDYLGGSGSRGYGKVDVSDIIKKIKELLDEANKPEK